MHPLSLIAGALICLYGILNAFAGFSQLKAKEIQPWSAWLMLGTGLLLTVSGVTMAMQLSFSLFVLMIGLLAIHLLTINNGYRLHGKINLRHHLFRLVVSVILVFLSFWSLG
jgi:hypothetical protein